MAIKKPVERQGKGLVNAQQQAKKIRRQLKSKPGPSKLLTRRELADAAPFYLVLRDYVGQLKNARESAGLTLADVSERTGMAIESLSRLETGALTNPTWKTLGSYAKAVGRRPLLTTEDVARKETEMQADRFRRFDLSAPQTKSDILGAGREFLESIQIPAYISGDDGFGFPGIRVYEVCESPTRMHFVQLEDLRATVYIKECREYADVVGIQEVAKDKHKIVSFAFRAFADLCEKPLTDLTPLEIVEEMANRFGLEMSIGSTQGKFFLEREFQKSRVVIPGRDPNKIIHVETHSRSFVTGFAFKTDGQKIHVALAFSLDTKAYQDWIASHDK